MTLLIQLNHFWPRLTVQPCEIHGVLFPAKSTTLTAQIAISILRFVDKHRHTQLNCADSARQRIE